MRLTRDLRPVCNNGRCNFIFISIFSSPSLVLHSHTHTPIESRARSGQQGYPLSPRSSHPTHTSQSVVRRRPFAFLSSLIAHANTQREELSI